MGSARAGAIQAIDAKGLADWARRHDCLVVLRRRVGDFIPADAVLFEIFGDGQPGGATDQYTLRGMVALGTERTVEQDPAFAIRIMVDIADKALSAAINDPTTAVQVLDHLEEVLRLIGATELGGRIWRVDDAPGQRRRDPGPNLGAIHLAGRHRNPRVRRKLDPGDAPHARGAARRRPT